MSTDKKDTKDDVTSDVEEDSETETELTSSADMDPSQASVFGNLRTRLRWQTDSRTMCIDVRQYAQNRRRLEVKYKGRLDTQSGDYQYSAQVQRLMVQNTPSLARIMAAERGVELEGDDAININRFLPAGLTTLLFKDWTLAPGLRVSSWGHTPAAAAAAAAAVPSGATPAAGSSSSSNGQLRCCVTLKKQPQVLWRRGLWDSWLQGKVDLQYNAQQQVVEAQGGVRLKVLRMQVTDKQDLQLTLGADFSSSSSSSSKAAESCGGGGGTLTPYIKVSENSWAIRMSRGSVAFTYDI